MAFNTTLITAQCALVTASTNGKTTIGPYYGLYVGGTNGQAKNINIVDGRGTTTLFTGVSVGTILPVMITAIRTTNTTASLMIGFGPQ